MILPTVTAKINSVEKYETENTTLVLFVRNVPSPPKIVLTAVSNIIPVTAAFPATETPTVTFPTSPAPMAVLLTTAVRSVPPVKTTWIAVRRRFPVTTAVPQPTPVVSVLLVRAIRIVTCPINLVTADVLPQTPAANVLPASPVRLRTLVPAFPAALTPTAPVALVTATPDIRAMQIPDVPQFQKILARV